MSAKPQNIQLRQREERRRVMLPARMRSSTGWSDACILNISTRGLLIYALGSADPGSFVEIRRGNQLVVARVVWRQNQRIGLQTPDPVRIAEIISSDTAEAAAAVPVIVPVKPDRRKIDRDWENSRAFGRAVEFLALVVIALALGALVSAYVLDILSQPVSRVSGALGGQ
jgi:hypothetical protein